MRFLPITTKHRRNRKNRNFTRAVFYYILFSYNLLLCYLAKGLRKFYKTKSDKGVKRGRVEMLSDRGEELSIVVNLKSRKTIAIVKPKLSLLQCQ